MRRPFSPSRRQIRYTRSLPTRRTMMTEPLCRSSACLALLQQRLLFMVKHEELQQLISKWTIDSEDFKAEARRLERSDLSRYAAFVAMLEAHAQAIERCILEVQILGEPD